MNVTKIDAARRQLDAAIRMWFADDDPVSIHTLAASAHQVIHDLNRRKKGPPLFFDGGEFDKETRKKFVSAIKSAAWFMKHADRGKAALTDAIDFQPELNNFLIIFSIIGLGYLGQKRTAEQFAFESFTILHNPGVLPNEQKEFLLKNFPEQGLALLRSAPKKKFFEALLPIFGQLPLKS